MSEQRGNMSSFLRPPVAETLTVVLPKEVYPAVIKKYEVVEFNGNKRLRLPLGLTDWPDSIPASQRVQTVELPDQTTVEVPIDLSKRQYNKDFFAYWAIDNFLEAMGLEASVDMAGNKDYETPLSKLIGMRVAVTIDRIMSRDGSHYLNVVGDVFPLKTT